MNSPHVSYVENITSKFTGDLSVVNAARVSFDKWKEEFGPEDQKLLNYLAKHNHWTPFGHPQLAFIREGSVNYYVDWCTNSGPGFRRMIVGQNAGGYVWAERGSLYAYIRTFGNYEPDIAVSMFARYPGCMEAFLAGKVDHSKLISNAGTVDITDSIFDEKSLSTALAANGLERKRPLMLMLGAAHLRLKQPIPIAREWFRSEYDLVRNEVSRRYVDEEPDMFIPEYLRKKSETAKQGSLAEPIDKHDEVMGHYRTAIEYGKGVYLAMIEEGVAPEVARFVLPQSMYTSFIETGSIDAYLRIYGLRAAADAQMEVRQYAHELREVLEPTWPKMWGDVGTQTWKPELAETNGGVDLLIAPTNLNSN